MTSAAEDTDRAESTVNAIGEAAGRGLRWSLLGTVVMKIASFGMGLVLARLLSPEDFGLYAVAMSATQFVMHINDVGLIAAAVQWRGKFEEMAPTATTLALGVSLMVYVAFWIFTPTFSAMAGSPAATPIVRLLTFTIVIDGITAVRSASLMRNFQQDRLMTATVIGFAATFVTSISLALAGGRAYAFAGGQVTGALLTGLLVLVLARVPIQFAVDRAIAGKLLAFGLPLAASLGVEALIMNTDYVIVGQYLGTAMLGFYLLAFNTSSWAVSLMGTAIRYVSIPAFSRLSDSREEGESPDGDDSLSRGVQKSVVALVLAVTPIVALIASLAPEMVFVLYGTIWAPAAPVLRFLMILTAVRLLTSLVLDVLTGAGATRLSFLVNLAWASALLPALYIGTRAGGIRGTAIAHVLVGVLVAVPAATLALRRLGVRLAPIARHLVRPILAGVLTAVLTTAVASAVGGALDGWSLKALAQLSCAGCAGLTCYVLTAVPYSTTRGVIRDGVARIRRKRLVGLDSA